MVSEQRPDLVLVHGSTQGPAGFDALTAALNGRGYRTFTPALRAGPDATAADHADVLAGQLPDHLDGPVVLAHSVAGLVLPALARRLNARHQLWLAAAVADYRGRRSFLDEVHAEPTAVLSPEWIGIDPTGDRALATYFLFHDADLTALRRGLDTLALTALPAVAAEAPVDDPAGVTSTYLLPVQDRTLQPSWMRSVARERLGAELVELDGGHNLYVGQPDLVADAVVAAL